MSKHATFRIAAIQACPVYMNLEATIDKACALITEAGEQGASLVVFPEAFVPGYPVWVWFVPPGHTKPLREAYSLLHANSISIPGPETDRLGAAARAAGVTVVMGVNEINTESSGASLTCTLLYIGADGNILGSHRKLVPTGGERLVWGRGDGSDLEVYDTPFGKLGGLVCWENYMPLARHALSAMGIQIHAAPTWDHGEPWLSSMRHIAKESRCFVVGCCSPVRKTDLPESLGCVADYLADAPDWLNSGDSLIVDPDGKVVAGPAHKEETILFADVEPTQLIGPRWQLDVAGHYSRPDVFRLLFNNEVKPQLLADPTLTELTEPDG